jgi:hypothetical protein
MTARVREYRLRTSMVRRGRRFESVRGLEEKPCKRACCVARDGEILIRRGYEAGTFWDWRALAGIRDASRPTRRRAPETRSRLLTRKVPAKQPSALPVLARSLTTSFTSEVVALFMVETRRSHLRFGRVEAEREAGLDLTH